MFWRTAAALGVASRKICIAVTIFLGLASADAQTIRAFRMDDLQFGFVEGDASGVSIAGVDATYYSGSNGGDTVSTPFSWRGERDGSPPKWPGSYGVQSIWGLSADGRLVAAFSEVLNLVTSSIQPMPAGFEVTGFSGDQKTWVGRRISDDGPVLGVRAARVVDGGPPEVIGPRDSSARAASFDGSVIVGNGSMSSFRWTAAAGLETLSSERRYSYNVSDDGSVALLRAYEETFRWTAAAGTVKIGAFSAGGMTKDGSMVVGTRRLVSGRTDPVFWTEADGVRRLAPFLNEKLGGAAAGWEFTKAIAISRDGNLLLGQGRFLGQSMAWLVQLDGVLPPALPVLKGWAYPPGKKFASPRVIQVSVVAANTTRVTLTNGRFRRIHRPHSRLWTVRVPLHPGENVIRVRAEGAGEIPVLTMPVTVESRP